MRHFDYFVIRYWNRLKLKLTYRSQHKREDITIVIGVKNRCDYRLVNAFKSLRNQTYNQDLISIVLVDYDSDEGLVDRYKTMCETYRVCYIRIDNKPVWNKSHCLNIAIKNVDTKYLCSSDVDVFFEKNYISECIKELQARPLQVLISDFYNTPEGLIDAEVDVVNDYEAYKQACNFQYTGIGFNGTLNVGINLALTDFYKMIHGYDEYYILWGSEDRDLIKRLALLGLKVKNISGKTSWIHQCHEKQEGVNKHANAKEQIAVNRRYLHENHSVIRNRKGWGNI